MNDIGFVMSSKENERRRALSPAHVTRLRHASHLHFETGYGAVLGADDADYVAVGARCVPRNDAWACSAVCCVKAPTVADRELLSGGQTIFGWLHAVQNRDVTDMLVEGGMTGIAWEEMVAADGYIRRGNRQLTGEAGVPHYAVDHVPALVWRSATDVIGDALIPYVDTLVEGREEEDPVLRAATVVRRGSIVDRRITEFQGR